MYLFQTTVVLLNVMARFKVWPASLTSVCDHLKTDGQSEELVSVVVRVLYMQTVLPN